MYQLNPLVESKLLRRSGALFGAVGGAANLGLKGSLIGTGAGGIAHLIKRDEDLDELRKTDPEAYKRERRHRLKRRLIKGAKIGAAAGGTVGALSGGTGGYLIGRAADEIVDANHGDYGKVTEYMKSFRKQRR